MTGPSAGSYDPVPAVFLLPQRGETEAGEPTHVTYTTFCRRYVRFMMKATFDANRETAERGQLVSQDMLVFRARRDSRTEQIGPTFLVEHRGQTWQIVGVNQLDYAFDEVEFLAKRVNQPFEPVV